MQTASRAEGVQVTNGFLITGLRRVVLSISFPNPRELHYRVPYILLPPL